MPGGDDGRGQGLRTLPLALLVSYRPLARIFSSREPQRSVPIDLVGSADGRIAI